MVFHPIGTSEIDRSVSVSVIIICHLTCTGCPENCDGLNYTVVAIQIQFWLPCINQENKCESLCFSAAKAAL